ncbi:hypothetical protein ACS0TY_028783 [Phlomoides rotata]
MNRKGHVNVNMLGVCDINMRFVYVLTGWEGSAVDSRVLRGAVNHNHGLKIPIGFLTPYKGVLKYFRNTSILSTRDKKFHRTHIRSIKNTLGDITYPFLAPCQNS